MARYDFRSPRLYLDAALARADAIPLDRAQVNYLQNVLRLPKGAAVLVFNGRDGEWRAQLKEFGKRGAALEISDQTRAQTAPSDLHWVFAPLKHARLDYTVQKAVEMGVSRLQPITTRHSQVTRVNGERMRANAIEAAEQCGILTLPEIGEPTTLDQFMAVRAPDRTLIFCDEDAPAKDPVAELAAARKSSGTPRPPLALLIGPEGGFAEEERLALLRLPNVVRLALGPRILRADTAAVAALALVQAVLGDWRADATRGEG
jgi:16S rRNA (uracil1498-N3)-methyltransferase